MRTQSIGGARTERGITPRAYFALASASAAAWLGLLLAALPPGPPPPAAPAVAIDRASLRPDGWRRVVLPPDRVSATSGLVAWQSGRPGRPCLAWQFTRGPGPGEAVLHFRIPADPDRRDLLWFGVVSAPPAGEIEVSVDVIEAGAWKTLNSRHLGPRIEAPSLQCSAILPYACGRAGRVRVSWGEHGPSYPARVEQMQWFRLSPTGRNDSWLFAGASITEAAIRATRDTEGMWALARDEFPGADPLIVQLSGTGWTSDDLLARMPGFLRAHPHIRFVCLDVGGNNITRGRPFPGGANRLLADTTALLETIWAAGKVPIMARLPYRAHPVPPTVPPESNGAGPYVRYILDPLIARHCPLFYDRPRRRGSIDLYSHFREHPDELMPDGIHHTPEGRENWRRIWMHEAGRVIYGARRFARPRRAPATPGRSTPQPDMSMQRPLG